MDFLRDYQEEAVAKMKNGCILNGGVGSGKSRTSLYYYFTQNGGKISKETITPMKNPKPLYIITTAKKRNDMEWQKEIIPFGFDYHDVVIDSWNNIKKYTNVVGCFFIFDEDKVTGSGAWVKAFYKIANKNRWIILSATPGDSWEQYIPVFVANGFYHNKSEFLREHAVFCRYSKYPKIDKWIGTGRLIKHRNDILVNMDFQRKTVRHNEYIYCEHDKIIYKDVMRNRWDIYKNEPIQQAAGLCYVLRRLVNEDEDRQVRLLELLEDHERAIIFYNYDYELEILRGLGYHSKTKIAEYNGHMHQEVPDSKRWVYLVQYSAGCEGWNCITTDTIIFFSQNYSYRVLEQAQGRIDRMNTPFIDLYYYHFMSHSNIDMQIRQAIKTKKLFNEGKFVEWAK